MSASAISNVPPEAIAEAIGELTKTKRAINEANSAHRLAIKRHRGNGVPIREVLNSVADSLIETDERNRRMRDTVRVAAIRYPDSIPIDLFSNLDIKLTDKARLTQTIADAEFQGYHAGRAGKSGDDNPYPSGSELAQAWARQRAAGFDIYETNLGPGGTPATPTRKRARNNVLPMELPKTKKAVAKKAVAPAKRGRGRPKGSKNKPKDGNGQMPAHV